MKGISAKKTKAIIALLDSPTMQEAAKTLNISEVSLWRYLQQPEFKKAYLGAKKQAIEQAITRLQQISKEAVETFREVMNDKGAPASSRIAAARSVLEFAFRGIEINDLEERITELEGRVIKK